jgi:hypothetical protein
MKLFVGDVSNLEIGFGGALSGVIVLHDKNTVLRALNVEIKHVDTGFNGFLERIDGRMRRNVFCAGMAQNDGATESKDPVDCRSRRLRNCRGCRG